MADVAASSRKIRAIFLVFILFLFTSARASIEQRCKKPKFTNCTMIYAKMHLWCDHTNLESIPVPKKLVGKFDAPPEKSTTIIFKQSCVTRINQSSLAHYAWVVLLDLTGNFIEVLQVNTFPRLENLKKLFLTSNRLRSIDDRTFDDLSNLEDLRLDHNQIESISESTFSGLSSLQTLKLSNNKLSTLSEEAFRKLPQLRILDLSGNQLADFLPEHLVSLSNLRSINLTSNNLQTFDSHIYLAASGIREIYLKNNSIECFSANSFEQRGLTVIDIADNPLKRPHFKWFTQFVRENDAPTAAHHPIVMSKSGSWICDCKVYSYHNFLSTLPHKWLKMLDIECSEPPALKGKMLSSLNRQQLFSKRCSTPDGDDLCPDNEISTYDFTTNTTPTTTSTAPVTTAIVSSTSTDKTISTTLKTTPPERPTKPTFAARLPGRGLSQNSQLMLLVIALIAGALLLIASMGFCFYRFQRHKKMSKSSNDFSESDATNRDSREDSGIQPRPLQEVLQTARIPPSGRSDGYTESVNEFDSISNSQDTRPKRVIETPPASFETSSVSTHAYESLNLNNYYQNPTPISLIKQQGVQPHSYERGSFTQPSVHIHLNPTVHSPMQNQQPFSQQQTGSQINYLQHHAPQIPSDYLKLSGFQTSGNFPQHLEPQMANNNPRHPGSQTASNYSQHQGPQTANSYPQQPGPQTASSFPQHLGPQPSNNNPQHPEPQTANNNPQQLGPQTTNNYMQNPVSQLSNNYPQHPISQMATIYSLHSRSENPNSIEQQPGIYVSNNQQQLPTVYEPGYLNNVSIHQPT